MRFKSVVAPFLLVAFLLTAGTAMADQWPMPPFTSDHSDVELVGFMEFITTGYVGNNIYDPGVDLFYSAQSVSGTGLVTVIGGEAGHLNEFVVDGTALFNNRGSGTWQTIDFDSKEAIFRDTKTGYTFSAEDTQFDPDSEYPGLELWVLDKQVTLAYLSDLVLPIGTVIAGFNDDYMDDNHDDMIMAYIGVDFTEPVPEPGTILLLSSGLIGLVGYRRKFRK